MSKTLYLASKSPRRRDLLDQLGVKYLCIDASVDETPLYNETPEALVLRLAHEKARAGWSVLGEAESVMVLGADTIVVVDGRILGKPVDEAEALAMLACLSARRHEVLTAVAVCGDKGRRSVLRRSTIWFRPISVQEAVDYWHSGEPRDKAGSYAIQGAGGRFVTRIDGSYTGVVGLPLYETETLLADYCEDR
ncbi:MAG: Maf family protein [Pseudomonadales bacterium]